MEDLKPLEDLPTGHPSEPSEDSIHKYQKKTSSITYLMEYTRVDIVKTTRKLA